jgi:SET domain-containing protein
MYRPLPLSLEIRPSQIHGNGLFTVDHIPSGTNLGISHVYHDWFPDGWIRTPLGGFYNHSDTPNCKLIGKVLDEGFITDVQFLVTIVDIESNEELTCTYTLWNPLEIVEQGSKYMK